MGAAAPNLRSGSRGDRGGWLARLRLDLGLGRAANDAMRGADLYHLVSISGMYMAMLAASCFWLARAPVAAVAPLALRPDARKSAAAAALPASAFYPCSGGARCGDRADLRRWLR